MRVPNEAFSKRSTTLFGWVKALVRVAHSISSEIQWRCIAQLWNNV